MENREGVIKGIERSEGDSQRGHWVRYAFDVDGKTYSTFDEALATQFKIGDYVKMEGEQQGKYWNVKGMKKVDAKDIKSEKVAENGSNDELKVVIDLLRQILATLKTNGD